MTHVRREGTCVSNTEAEGRFDCNFELFSVDFCHSFDLPEHHSIAIFEAMHFVLVIEDYSFGVLGNSYNNSRLALLPIGIVHSVIITKVYKGKPI